MHSRVMVSLFCVLALVASTAHASIEVASWNVKHLGCYRH